MLTSIVHILYGLWGRSRCLGPKSAKHVTGLITSTLLHRVREDIISRTTPDDEPPAIAHLVNSTAVRAQLPIWAGQTGDPGGFGFEHINL